MKLIFAFLAVLPVGAGAQLRATPYSEVTAALTQIAREFPRTTKLMTIGKGDSGDQIMGLKIGNGPSNSMVVATHHGDEPVSTIVAMSLARDLARRPIIGLSVYVIPVLNISGYNAGTREEFLRGAKIDPNRDYPGPCGTLGPFKLKSTALLARFVESNKIITSATLHTAYPAVAYPWGVTSNDLRTHYDDIFAKLGDLATKESGYKIGHTTDVMYPANGTFEDYAFWKLGIWSILFELGDTNRPNRTQLEHIVRVNLPGLRRMLSAAPRQRAPAHGFQGRCETTLRSFDPRRE